jgi:hypothetical protein
MLSREREVRRQVMVWGRARVVGFRVCAVPFCWFVAQAGQKDSDGVKCGMWVGGSLQAATEGSIGIVDMFIGGTNTK